MHHSDKKERDVRRQQL